MEKKTKKSKKQRKLLLAILMLLLTGGMLASTSYAWFTANKIVTVSTVNVNVAATNGLQISVDGLDWKAVITNEDIMNTLDVEPGGVSTYTSNTNQLPMKYGASSGSTLAPVSTVGKIDGDGLMEMYLGTLEPNETTGVYELKAQKSTETRGTSGNFVVFDLFFQVQEETQIYLTSNSAVTADSTANTGIQNAARVAFINEGNIASGSAAAQIQGLYFDGSVAGATPDVKIWEPNFDVHTSTGVANALNAYGISTSQTGAAALKYLGIKSNITTPIAVDQDPYNIDNSDPSNPVNLWDTDKFEEVTPTLYTPVAGISDNNYQKIFVLQPGITKMRVYLWIEGQDVDCENMASGGKIDFNMQFSSNKDKAGNPGSIS